MFKKISFIVSCFLIISFSFIGVVYSQTPQEDKIGRIAIDAAKTQLRIPPNLEVKFIEKKESGIPDFYSVKLMVSTPVEDIPLVVYVDKKGEKIIIGSLFVKGENLTAKETGPSIRKKIDMGQLEIEKSPVRGPADAKVTIVEFANFQCPYCLNSWKKMKEVIEKNPQKIRYIFKNFPLQPQGASFDISEMVGAVQELGSKPFWTIHDYFFTDAGQELLTKGKADIKNKIEQILQENGQEVQAFQKALDGGKGKKRLEEDIALGRKLQIMGTPTNVVNGEFVQGAIPDTLLTQLLGN